jgi:exonuclease III
MSSSGKLNQYLKLYGIAKLGSDIIFISDTRVCGRNMVSGMDDIKNIFLHNPYGSYECFFNSSSNKRGVGILIKKNLNFSVLRTIADPEENYLLLEVAIAGKSITLGSVYGPNSTNREFFANLERDVNTLDNNNCVLAGD